MSAVRSNPVIIGALAGFAMLVTVVLAMQCGCLFPKVYKAPPMARLTDADRAPLVVRVDVLCVENDPFEDMTPPRFSGGIGSGVMIDSRHVVTAAHVVKCAYLPDIHVITADGRKMRVVVAHEEPKRDLALLELASADSFGPIAPHIYARPAVGDVVCAYHAFPERGASCGAVEEVSDAIDSDTKFGGVTHPGYSGGPVFDAEGRLAGIITELVLPNGDDGGRFTSLSPAIIQELTR